MKKILATILSVIMLLNFMIVPALADDPQWWETKDNNKADLSFVYLGNGTSPLKTAQDFPTTAPAAGDTIWIGVQFSNMSKLRTLFNSGQRTANSGLNNVTMGVLYDSNILTPITTSATNMLKNLTKSVDYPYDDDSEESLYQYSSMQRTGTNGLDDDSESNNISNVKSYSETFGVNTEAALYYADDEGASAPRIFQDNVEPFKTGQVGDDPVIYGFFGFTVKSGVTITPGQTYLQAGLGQNIFSIGLGNKGEGDGMALAWNQEATTDVSTNLKNYFNLTDKDGNPTGPEIDFWPPSYTVDFYNDSTLATTVGTQLTIKEKETVSTTDVPADSDFTAPDGKYFDKLLYFVDADGTGTADPDNDAEFIAGTTQITGNTKVYATYKDGYKVTFDSNYGQFAITNPPADKKVVITVAPEADQVINEDDKPDAEFTAPTGWSLVGWYTDQACADADEFKFETAAGGDGTKIDGSTGTGKTLYAKWAQEVTYTFKLNYDGAPADTTVKQTAGEALGTAKAPADPTRTDYDFKGWDTVSNGTGTRYADQTAVAALTESSNTTLYAIWEAASTLPEDQKATITFHSSVDGLAVAPPSITVKKGDKLIASQLPTPTRTDYTLEGWYDAADVTGTKVTDTDGSITVDDDMDAYAHWTYTGTDPVTVTFNAPDADGTTKTWTVTIGRGDVVGAAAPVVTRDGWTFDKWQDETSKAVYDPANDAVTENSKTVEAVWTEKITIKFDANTGSGTAADQVGDPTDMLALPADGTFTKTDYKLVGWNTAKNGSGKYVDNTKTLDAVKTAAGATTSTVTLYAQWADVDNPDDGKTGPNTPADGGVCVTFDSNAAGSLNPAPGDIEEADPKYKYPKYNDPIGTDQMPNEPKRKNYVFVKWNTKPDGSGKDVDGTTAIGANLDPDIVENPTNKYAVTLYAQWDIDTTKVPENNQITVKFNDNEDGKGTDNDGVKTITVVRGDSIGYPLPTPADTKKAFLGWFEGTAGDGGVIGFTGAKLESTTPIDPTGTEVTYYAKNEMFLWVQLDTVEADGTTAIEYTYDGTEQDPTYKVWAVEKTNPGDTTGNKLSTTPIVEGNAAALAAKGIVITYKKDGATATLVKAGTYSIDVAIASASELEAQGANVSLTSPDSIEIKAKEIDVTLDPDKQEEKKTATQEYVDVDDLILDATALISGDTKEKVLEVKYKLWDDKNNNGVIDNGELTDTPNTSLDIGTYVMEIGTQQDSNYAIKSVASSVDGKTIAVFDATQYPAAYPNGNLKTIGSNLKFTIIPNEPKATDIKVTKTGSTDALALTTDDYSTAKPFVSEDTSTDGKDEYWVRIDNTTDSVDVYVTNESYFTAQVDGNNLTDGKVTISGLKEAIETNADGTPKRNEDGTLAKNDPQVIEVVVSNSSGDTKTYKIHVQRVGKESIELRPGNSPFGLIERMADKYFVPDPAKTEAENATAKANYWTEAKVVAAKEAFANSDTAHGNLTYADGFVPSDAFTNVKYTERAWTSLDKNYDKVENAIFVYEKNIFVEPGLIAYNNLGEQVENPTFDRELIVKKMGVGEPDYSETASVTDLDLSVAGGNNSTVFSLVGNIIRPDKYVMNYTYTYKDAQGADQTLHLSRPVIVLSQRGDIQLTTDPSFNTNDGKAFAASYNKWGGKTANSLFAFRVCDVQFTTDATVNTNDYKQLAADLAKYSAFPYDQFYMELPKSAAAE